MRGLFVFLALSAALDANAQLDNGKGFPPTRKPGSGGSSGTGEFTTVTVDTDDGGAAADLVITETQLARSSGSDVVLTLTNPGAGVLSLVVEGDLTVDTNTICTTKATNRVGFGTCSAAFTVDVVGTLGVSGTTALSDSLTISHPTGSSTTAALIIAKIAGTGAELVSRYTNSENDATKFPLDISNTSSTSGVLQWGITAYTGTTSPDVAALVIRGVYPPGGAGAVPPVRVDCLKGGGTGSGDGITGANVALTAGRCFGWANAGTQTGWVDFEGKMNITTVPTTGTNAGALITGQWNTSASLLDTTIFNATYAGNSLNDTRTYWGYTYTAPGGTHTSAGTQTWNGYSALWNGSAITQTTAAGTINATAFNVTGAVLTQTTGTLTENGFNFNTPASGAIVTGGVMTGFSFTAPTTSGPAAGTLRGFWARNLTSAGAGTEIAVDVGTGYDLGIQSASVANLAAGIRDDDANHALDFSDAEGVRHSQTITSLKTCTASTQDASNAAAGTWVRYIKSNVEHVCACKQTGSGTFGWVGMTPSPDCT